MLGMLVAPRESWFPDGSGGKNIPLTTRIAPYPALSPLQLWRGQNTSLVYSLVLVSVVDISREEY